MTPIHHQKNPKATWRYCYLLASSFISLRDVTRYTTCHKIEWDVQNTYWRGEMSNWAYLEENRKKNKVTTVVSHRRVFEKEKLFYRSAEAADCVWNVMAHAQKPDFVFQRNGRAHLNRRGRHFSRLLAAEVCASAVVMLDTPCSEELWRVLATHSVRQFPLHFPFRASPCTITFQPDSTTNSQR